MVEDNYKSNCIQSYVSSIQSVILMRGINVANEGNIKFFQKFFSIYLHITFDQKIVIIIIPFIIVKN